ncbi:hypothetical protein [Thermococcus peptonophilus]
MCGITINSSEELSSFYPPRCMKDGIVLHDSGFYDVARKCFEELRRRE